MEVEMQDSKLHDAVRYGDTTVVREALLDGLDPNTIGFLQWTPVQEAACNGDLDILQILLKNKGDPNAKDKLLGSTAVHYAAKEGHVECLQALLDAGGIYDLHDNNGLTSLDVAVGKCYDLLDNWRVKVLAKTKIKTTFTSTLNEPKLEDRIPEKVEELVNKLPKAWEKEVPDENSMIHSSGHLQLSFEYNSKTKVFKIRVWMLHNLLLPPVEASTVSRVYVRSQLFPDKKGDSKRRTEEHTLGDNMWNQTLLTLRHKDHKESFKATFVPCTFNFFKALEYRNITKDIVANRVLHIDICAKQKYGRNFVIANIQMTLEEAVRKLMKEKFLLHPCFNICIPDNIHAYDPKDLVVCPEGMYRNLTTSNPNFRTKSSLSVENDIRRATSDNDLKAVRCHSTDSIPSISVDIPESNENMREILEEICTIDDRSKNNFLSKSNPEFMSIEMQNMSLPHTVDDELLHVKVLPASRSSPNITAIHMEDVEGDITFYVKGTDEKSSVTKQIIREKVTKKTKANNLKVDYGLQTPRYLMDLRESTTELLMVKMNSNEKTLAESKHATQTKDEQTPGSQQNDSNHLAEKYNINIKSVDIKPVKIKLKRAKQERTRIASLHSSISNDNVVPVDEALGQSASIPTQYTFSQPVTNDLVQTELGYSELIELDKIKQRKSVMQHLHYPQGMKGRSHSPLLDKSLESVSSLPPVQVGRSANNSTQLHIESEHSDPTKSERSKKMLATPEFRRKMFPRTKDGGHPALAYLTTNPRTSEEHALVFPETPTGTPISKSSHTNYRGRSSPSAANQLEKDEPGNLRNIDKRTISRLQQSWL